MCNNNNSHCSVAGLEASSMISVESTTVVALKLARKTRTKTRRPKFPSLRLELSSDNSLESGEVMAGNHHHPRLDLFPLHPENMVEDKDMPDENMAYIFAASDGGATLNGLLGGDDTCAEVPSEDSLSPSLTYAYGGRESEECPSTLVRTALRNRERDASEEKWVCYSEVVEKKEEEVTSSAADLWYKSHSHGLSLKLDYQEILNVWSGKGPLFIEGGSPQTVPDLVHDTANAMREGWSRLWKVPEMSVKMEEAEAGKESKMGPRQASVLRYKEKRQSRLFSKRIRYEVRKVNAETRPRMKGRFVKRS